MVKGVIVAVEKHKDFVIDTPRIVNAKRLAEELLQKVVDPENVHSSRFDVFAGQLLKSVKSTSVKDGRMKHSTRRRKMWSAFYQLQVGELSSLCMWEALLQDVGLKNDDTGKIHYCLPAMVNNIVISCSTLSIALFTEHINLELFETKVLLDFTPPVIQCPLAPLTKDELNALRYIAGYVPFKLLKKLQKRQEFRRWLEGMAVEGTETSFLDYTKEWIERVNRGGLFRVNDKAFVFFTHLELRVRTYLPKLLRTSSGITKEEVLRDIVENEDLILSWMAAIGDFEDEWLASELLQHVSELWLTIRGFSAAGAWMEYYKQCKEKLIEKNKALRKNLKRKHQELEQSEQ